MFFPNFLTFILETPSLFRQSRQRNLHSWDSNFVSTQKNWRHRRKRRLTSTFSYQLCSRRKQIFSYIERVHRTYVTVANQSTVHRTNPMKTRHTSVASPSNKSFRTNTFVRRWHTIVRFLKLFCLTGNHNWSESILFLQPDSVNTQRCLQNHRPKNICILLTFKRPANL